jgi:hypothetical protein
VSALGRALRGLIGLFVDDGKLALILIVVLTVAGLLAHFRALDQALTLALLVGGTVSALLANVIRAALLTRR